MAVKKASFDSTKHTACVAQFAAAVKNGARHALKNHLMATRPQLSLLL